MLGGVVARFGNRRVLRTVLTGLPVALVLYALAPTLWLAVIAIFFVGLFYLGCLSSFTTIAQLRAPAELHGRVLGALMVLLGTLYPIGSILQGAVANKTSLRVTTARDRGPAGCSRSWRSECCDRTTTVTSTTSPTRPTRPRPRRPTPRRPARPTGQISVACRRSTDGDGERGGSCDDGPTARLRPAVPEILTLNRPERATP